MAINGGFGGLDGARGASLDLDEAKHVLVIPVANPANQVEFAVVVGRAEVARDDGVAVATQEKVGSFFAAPAGLKVRAVSSGGRARSVSQSRARRVGGVRRLGAWDSVASWGENPR